MKISNKMVDDILKKVELKEMKDGTGIFLINHNIGVIGYGDTREEALEQVKTSLKIVFDEYYDEDDENLTETAKKLKRNLHELVDKNIDK